MTRVRPRYALHEDFWRVIFVFRARHLITESEENASIVDERKEENNKYEWCQDSALVFHENKLKR